MLCCLLNILPIQVYRLQSFREKMYIKIRNVNGQQETILQVSAQLKIADLKAEIQNAFSIKKSKQALYFSGKHLEDENTLFDYNIKLNNVILLMQKSDKPCLHGKDTNDEKNIIDKPIKDTDETPAESLYYKVGDPVDCTDATLGSWFESVIVKIIKRSDSIVYKMRWDLTDSSDELFEADETKIRPRSWKVLKLNDLQPGQKVMINYNLEERKEVGYWYDFTVSKIMKSGKQLKGTLHIGGDGASTIENCTVPVNSDIFAIEEPVLLKNQDDNLIAQIPTKKRILPYNCSHCKDNDKKLCRECSCRVCGYKNDPHMQLLCDECNNAFHLGCLDPPLSKLPVDDYWYCPDCKRDDSEIVKVGVKVKPKKIKSKAVGSTRDWGKGFACIGRTKTCTHVPPNHRGPIPGVDVGTSWMLRLQVSEAGVHRPPVSGIAGREKDCAYSLVLSGGYEDDVDNGDTFVYTGAGGRDLSGNKRTAVQSSDQKLTKTNKALAMNCYAKINEIKGAESKDWKMGIPIRVVRSSKLRKHSIYAPECGNRYDGIYKVVKYWPEKGKSGFIVWRYLMKRDDPDPAPWTAAGKKKIAKYGLKMIYPDGYEEAQKAKQSGLKRKSKEDDKSSTGTDNKKVKVAYGLDKTVKKMISMDNQNEKIWKLCNKSLSEGKLIYLAKVTEEFTCSICQELVLKPVTLPCIHNVCLCCLKLSFEKNKYECPMCRTCLGTGFRICVNEHLSEILLALFPGYDRRS